MTVVGDTVFDVLDVAKAGCRELSIFEFSLAGSGIHVCAGTFSLLRQVTEALRHRQSTLTGSPDLTIFAWENQPLPTLAVPPEWRVAERWQRRESVRAMSQQGMMYFDAIGGEVALLDMAGSRAAAWFGPAGVLPIWIATAPFLRILDAWFVARGRILCHGAAIAKDGGAALLVGPNGAGKSTLALHASDQSFEYLGDDYVLLEPTFPGATVHSVYCSGKLTEADMAAAPPRSVNIHRAADEPNEKSFLLPEPTMLCASAPLKMVIEPRFGGDEAPRLEPISPAAGLRSAVPSVLRQLPGAEQRKLALLAGALAVPCFRLHMARDHRRNLDVIAEAMAR